MSDSDRQLLANWRAGDRAAGNALLQRHFHSLYRFFSHKVGDRVEDLIQQTMLACLEKLESFRQESSFRTFLFGIARYELFGYWRSRDRDGKLDFSVSSLYELSPSASSVAVRHQEQRIILEALRRIPLDLQITVELHYWEGMSGPQLAEILEIPEGTVRSRLRRAREALLAQLETLEVSGSHLRSTLDNLERWARSIGAAFDAGQSAK